MYQCFYFVLHLSHTYVTYVTPVTLIALYPGLRTSQSAAYILQLTLILWNTVFCFCRSSKL